MRRHTRSPLLALAFALGTWMAAGAVLAVDPPPTTVVVDWYKLTDIWQSTDPAFSAPFGGALISGFPNAAIQVNDQHLSVGFASIKFAQTPALRAEVQVCFDRAAAAAGMMETQAMAGNPGGRNTQFIMKVTGAINVNSGNTRVNPGDWTILEVSSFRSMVCQISTFIP